ncbi:unnamed protein product [Gulo gulo]|uniref:Uncharacterized protein n=1 Tax=Gulo gulo TaxID=48420 RepID=A0A9X9LYE0_GULGU|nr:unnamed protein product [Gulo gulo]
MRQLKSVPSHTCLKDRTYLRVPWERQTITQIQKTQSTCFHHQMLPQIFSLFSTDQSQAAWSHAALHDLLSSLHHCLGHWKPSEEDNSACLCLGIMVWKDVQSIHLYLKEKKHSCCAREVVRPEMQRPFSSFHNPQVQEKVIIRTLSNQ